MNGFEAVFSAAVLAAAYVISGRPEDRIQWWRTWSDLKERRRR